MFSLKIYRIRLQSIYVNSISKKIIDESARIRICSKRYVKKNSLKYKKSI